MKKSELFELLDKELTNEDRKVLTDYVFDKKKNEEWINQTKANLGQMMN